MTVPFDRDFAMLALSPAPKKAASRPASNRRGSVFVEYVLLVTLVGLGTLAGVAILRNALIAELQDLALAIAAII
jgi:pilus assembly protein Flp/PilA